MAYFCPDCKIMFESRVSNCPSCGFGIASDDKDGPYYLEQGYIRYQSPCRTASDGIHIEDGDVLDDLRRRYNDNFANHTSHKVSDPSSKPERKSSETSSQLNDFFADFANNDLRTPETCVNPEPEFLRDSAPSDSRAEPSLRRTTFTRTHSYTTPRRRFGGFGGFSSFWRQIPWRVIIYFAFFISVISIIVWIWKMRFAILDSVVNFLGVLMPIAIISIAIIYLVRRIFR